MVVMQTPITKPVLPSARRHTILLPAARTLTWLLKRLRVPMILEVVELSRASALLDALGALRVLKLSRPREMSRLLISRVSRVSRVRPSLISMLCQVSIPYLRTCKAYN